MSFRCLSRPLKTSGFTLIEVLITMAILALISLGIFQAVTSSFKLREDLNTDGDFYTGIRVAMNILSQDVSSIYTPMALLPSKPNPTPSGAPTTPGANPNPPAPAGTDGRGATNFDEKDIPAATAAELNQVTQFWSAAADKTGIRPSRFVGTESKMSFVTSNNLRIYKDSPESIFAKVTYQISTDPSPPANGYKVPDSQALVREVSADAFDIDESRYKASMHSYTMLRGITKSKFTYYRWKDNSFTAYNSWDSDTEDFKYQMPDKIELTITVKGQGVSFDGLFTFKPELNSHGLIPSF